MQNTMVKGGGMGMPDGRKLVRRGKKKKFISTEGGGGIIEMHNIHPCSYIKREKTSWTYDK